MMGPEIFKVALVVLPKDLRIKINQLSPYTALHIAMNLCLQDISRDSKCVEEALNFAMKVIQLMKYSPKQQVILEIV